MYENIYKSYEVPKRTNSPCISSEIDGERGNCEKTERVKTNRQKLYIAAPCREQYKVLISECPDPKTGNLILSKWMSEPLTTVYSICLFLPENVFLKLVYPS